MDKEELNFNIQEILQKIYKLELRHLEMKKEMKDIKERFNKHEKTKVIF